MLKFRLSAAILAGKLAAWLSRLRGHKGSSLPGLVARKIYTGCLRDLAGQVRRGIIVTTGTNGKTTTNNMIAGVLTGAGHKVVANLEGSNMITGVTACFILDAGIGGGIECDYAVLEVDEASMPAVLAEVKPGVVALTNFFRDQLDRYWEIDKIAGIIRDSLREQKQGALVLNADDPLVAQFGRTTGLPAVFYGLGQHGRATGTGVGVREARFCPFCGSAMEYNFFHYGQLGNYRCPGCSFARPDPRVEGLEPRVEDGVSGCRLVYDGREVFLTIHTRGLYNLYNALAAFTASLHLGIDVADILSGLVNYRPVTGRMERFIYEGREAYLNLVKNPTGFNEGIAALSAAPGTKDVFIAINDNDADGHDISWLWDVDFEILGLDHGSFLHFVCSGRRGEEMALRLKYAGVPVEKIMVVRELRPAIESALSGGAGVVYFFPTYTALWPVHRILGQLADGGGAHAQRMPFVL